MVCWGIFDDCHHIMEINLYLNLTELGLKNGHSNQVRMKNAHPSTLYDFLSFLPEFGQIDVRKFLALPNGKVDVLCFEKAKISANLGHLPLEV